MKTDIHPKYYPETKIKCACGHIYTIGSTKENIEVDICANCHPFYTGKENIIDAIGKVERFKKRRATASTTVTRKKTEKKAVKKIKKAEKKATEKPEIIK